MRSILPIGMFRGRDGGECGEGRVAGGRVAVVDLADWQVVGIFRGRCGNECGEGSVVGGRVAVVDLADWQVVGMFSVQDESECCGGRVAGALGFCRLSNAIVLYDIRKEIVHLLGLLFVTVVGSSQYEFELASRAGVRWSFFRYI